MSFIITAIKIIVILGFLVLIHETGHFVVARLCKIKVKEFAIGFGPVIWKKETKDTKYAIRLIPLGGFVNMLGEEEQLICDHNLMMLSILKKSPEDPNKIKLDLNLYLSTIASEDVKLIEDVRKQMKVLHPKNVKQSQRQIQINTLKNCIECSNYELLTALRDWVDGVYARPNGFLSKTTKSASIFC